MSEMPYLAKVIIAVGIALIICGLLIWLISGSIGSVLLPGDINYERGPVKISFPLGLSILASIIITIILNLILLLSVRNR